PLTPTATRPWPDQATDSRLSLVPDVAGVHVVPSGEVAIPPRRPTATSRDPVQTTSVKLSLVVAMMVGDHSLPSVERNAPPSSQTATNRAPVEATPRQEVTPTLCRFGHATRSGDEAKKAWPASANRPGAAARSNHTSLCWAVEPSVQARPSGDVDTM